MERLCGVDVPMPYANNLETAAVPQVCARTHTCPLPPFLHHPMQVLPGVPAVMCLPAFWLLPPLQVDNVIRAVLKSLNRKQ